MKKSLKLLVRAFAVIPCVLALPRLSAATISYFADSDSALDVQIDGHGAVGISPVVLSPSGFWSFNYQIADVVGFPNVGEIHALVRREMPSVGGFINPLFPVPTDVNYDEFPVMGSDSVGGDTINGLFTLHSGMALDDWEWSIRLTREGEATSLPDGMSTAGVLVIALAVLAVPGLLRRRVTLSS